MQKQYAEATQNHMLTTGYDFEGYTISEKENQSMRYRKVETGICCHCCRPPPYKYYTKQMF